MTIALAKDVEDFLEEQVRDGVCKDATEFANDVLRSVRESRLTPFISTPELEAWLLQAAEKHASPLVKSDFDSLRQRVMDRIPSKR